MVADRGRSLSVFGNDDDRGAGASIYGGDSTNNDRRAVPPNTTPYFSWCDSAHASCLWGCGTPRSLDRGHCPSVLGRRQGGDDSRRLVFARCTFPRPYVQDCTLQPVWCIGFC